jgi:hypothetical protein
MAVMKRLMQVEVHLTFAGEAASVQAYEALACM